MNTQAAHRSVKPDRRWDIDWLRVLVVLMLVPFHAARIFDEDPFYVKNDQLTVAFSYWFVRVGEAVAMKLLFLLAGAATWFALRRRSGGQYALERLKRLLIPFVVGLLVLAPPNAYFAQRAHSGYADSYLQFYPRFFGGSSGGGFLDFTGGFTVAHLWFILILFIISLVAIPLSLYLKRESGGRLIGKLAGFLTRPGMICLPVLPFVVMERLIYSYPGSFVGLGLVYYLLFFVFGYIMVADARFGEAIDRHKAVALILGPVLYVVLGAIQADMFTPEWLQFIYYHGFFPWLTIVAVLGYGRRHLGFTDGRRLSDKFLIYFGESSYSFYLLHLPVLVGIGYYVVQWNTNALLKYVTIVAATFVPTIILYEALIRRINVTRFLFGMRPKRRLTEMLAPREAES
jgi:glucan biosynthesis protein C